MSQQERETLSHRDMGPNFNFDSENPGLDDTYRNFSLDDDLESGHHERKGSYKERFKKAKEDIKRKKGPMDNNDVDRFFMEYVDVVGKSFTRPAGNLLHTLVDVVTHNGIQPEDIEFLVRRLVREYPNLLNNENEEKYNPHLYGYQSVSS
ncbi:hypothetical protein TGAMA5MH_06627 [Trichoderma gamsii]|uniref:Uncharacterized protein n=1 Tax=Trichoderma gamsii TaxID=398673 RepID=A0A2K0T7L6_9HYPO|nr:hypothetical protein TGAMA5MH_06627 [Trichoderma gamsii]